MRPALPSRVVRSTILGRSRLGRSRLGRSRLAVAITGLAVLGLLATSPLVALAAGTRTVTIAASSYSPVILTVEAGTTIVFDNTSAFPHTATADNGSFDTGMIAVGASKNITVSTPGVFPFFCQFHGAAGGVGQAGTITVTAAAAATPPPAGGGATSPTAAPGGGSLPPTATVADLMGFRDLTGIAFAIAIVLAVGLALAIDALRSRAARPRAE
jgi:plastocyanin